MTESKNTCRECGDDLDENGECPFCRRFEKLMNGELRPERPVPRGGY